MSRIALFALICLVFCAPALSEAAGGALPEVLVTSDTSMDGLMNLYHAVSSEHDPEDILAVRPLSAQNSEDLSELFAADPECAAGQRLKIAVPGAEPIALGDSEGEIIHVQLLGLSGSPSEVDCLAASLDPEALSCASDMLEQHANSAGTDLRDIVDEAAGDGAESGEFLLMNIDPAE